MKTLIGILTQGLSDTLSLGYVNLWSNSMGHEAFRFESISRRMEWNLVGILLGSVPCHYPDVRDEADGETPPNDPINESRFGT